MARDDRRWGKWRSYWMDVAEGRYPDITDGATPWSVKQVLIACGWTEEIELMKQGIDLHGLSSRLRSLRRRSC
jgi:hypothetical protein